jgi:SAM-dependent methyltransferase
MPEFVEICPLCSKNHNRLFDRLPYRGYLVENRLCVSCGLVFQSPRMADQELDNFYQAEYSQVYRGGKGILPKEIQIQHGRAAASLDMIHGFISQVERHLDFGCSTGIQLMDFHKKFGNEMVGVEPDPVRREHARENGVNAFPSLDELLVGEKGRFDLISLFHVLEHLGDPVEKLALFRQRFLAPGGRLLIEVPNLYAHDSFEVAHLFSFSRHTLTQTLRKAGYEIISLKKHGRPVSKILPLYITVLAHAMKDSEEASFSPVLPERGVAQKRALGMFWRRALQRVLPRLAWQPVG